MKNVKKFFLLETCKFILKQLDNFPVPRYDGGGKWECTWDSPPPLTPLCILPPTP